MSKNFKQLAATQRATQPRAAIPQVEPGEPKPAVIESSPPSREPVEAAPAQAPGTPTQTAPEPTPPYKPLADRPLYLTPVDTSEQKYNRGFLMYPSRHTQLTRDLAYIENRHPWEIIDDALEEYVVRRYGKEYRRR